MSCSITNPSGCISEGINNGVDSLAATFSDGADWTLKTLMGLWLKSPSPDVSSATSPVLWVQAHLGYLVVAAVVASVFIAAYRLATTTDFTHAGELAQSLVRVVLVGGLAATLTSTAVAVGDLFSEWILDQADVNLSAVVVLTAVQNSGILIILAVVVIVAQLIQLGLMLIRNGMIVMMVGALPLAASASNTQMGRQWYQKSFAWLVAFVVYKPVAAMIYAACYKMADAKQDLGTQLSGIFFMILAVFALPGLLRMVVPATAAMSGGNAGAMAGAAVGAALATGAVLATGGAAAAGAAGGGFSGGGFSGGASTTAATTPTATGAGPVTGTSGGGDGGGTTGGGGATGAGGSDGPAGLGGEAAASGGEGPAGAGAMQGGAGSAAGATGSPNASGQGPAGASGSGGGSSGGGAERISKLMNAAGTGADVARGVQSGAGEAVGDERA